jgi:hypothetical protein
MPAGKRRAHAHQRVARSNLWNINRFNTQVLFTVQNGSRHLLCRHS